MIAALVLCAQLSANIPNGPQCTQQGWYKRNCDQSWIFINPGMAGHIIPSGCAAHTELIYGSDGAQYALIDQCPQGCNGSQGLYKKPADALAAQRWAYYYTDPNAVLHRTQFGYVCASTCNAPSGLQVYSFITLAQMPDPPRQTYINSYQCQQGTPTPVPPTPTPVPNQFAATISWAANNGITAGCGGSNFCPDTPVTRAQLTAFLWNLYKLEHPGSILPPCQQQFLDVRCAP